MADTFLRDLGYDGGADDHVTLSPRERYNLEGSSARRAAPWDHARGGAVERNVVVARRRAAAQSRLCFGPRGRVKGRQAAADIAGALVDAGKVLDV